MLHLGAFNVLLWTFLLTEIMCSPTTGPSTTNMSQDLQAVGTEPKKNNTRVCKDRGLLVTYDSKLQICCNGILNRSSEDQTCCGGSIVNKTVTLCCNHIRYNRSEFRDKACCGTFLYDVYKFICCKDHLHKRSLNEQCCGEKVYNTSSDFQIFKPDLENSADVFCGGVSVTTKNRDAVCKCVLQNLKDKHTVILNRTLIISSEEESAPEQKSDRPSLTVAVSLLSGVVGVVSVSTAFGCYCLWKRRNISKKHCRTTSSNNKNNKLFDVGAKEDNSQLTFYYSNIDNTFFSSVTDRIERFKKASDCLINRNTLDYNFKSIETQTEEISISNKRDVFGKPFEHCFSVSTKKCSVQMPHSDVILKLPESAIKDHPMEVLCTSFRFMPEIRRKFGIVNDEQIASPVVEYSLTGYGNLSDYACVELPFIGEVSELSVWKFISDEGLLETPVKVKVQLKGKTNENLDLYYVVDESTVKIFTKSFSGFYCTISGHREVTLRAVVFGSYKRILGNLEVRVMLYVVDEIFQFEDYKANLKEMESYEGRVLKKIKQLTSPSTNQRLNENDILKFHFAPTEVEHWMHKPHPFEAGSPCFQPQQVMDLKDVVHSCQTCNNLHTSLDNGSYRGTEWYLINRPGAFPQYKFQGNIEVAFCSQDRTSQYSKTLIVLDELMLRPEDRLAVPESLQSDNLLQCVDGIKEHITALPDFQRNQILNALANKHLVDKSSVTEAFAQLRVKLTPNGLIEAVVTVLRQDSLFKVIDRLSKDGLIPEQFHTPPSQVTEDPDDAFLDLARGRTQGAADQCRREVSESLPCSLQRSTNFQQIFDSERPHRELSSNFSMYVTGQGLDETRTGVQEEAPQDNTHRKLLSIVPEERESLMSSLNSLSSKSET